MGRSGEDGDYDLYEWQDHGKYVCVRCVPDEFLKHLVCKNRIKRRCGFCGVERVRDIAAPVSVLIESIVWAFKQHFSDHANAGCSNDSEAQYLISPVCTLDALHELFPDLEDDGGQTSLLQYIAAGFQNESWVEAADGVWMGEHEHEALIWSWEKFANFVKHEQRFFFHVSKKSRSTKSLIPPSQMLSTIGNLVNIWNLFEQVDAETVLFRARSRFSDEDDWASNAEQLGAPTPKKAKAGRMNPAGISYLYTATDKATALAETLRGSPIAVVVGFWIVQKPMIVIDLTHLPNIPSVFDEVMYRDREALLFLDEFLEDIQKSISNSNDDDIDYLPSQVVCEYFSQVFKSDNDLQINGLKYKSSKRLTGTNVVFFPENNNGLENRFSSFKFNGSESLVQTDSV